MAGFASALPPSNGMFQGGHASRPWNDGRQDQHRRRLIVYPRRQATQPGPLRNARKRAGAKRQTTDGGWSVQDLIDAHDIGRSQGAVGAKPRFAVCSKGLADSLRTSRYRQATAGGMCKGENYCGGEFRTWPNGRISGVVAEFVDGTETVVVWIRGCTVPCHIKPTEKVAIGDTLELEAQVVGGGKKALALDCQGQTLTLDPKYAAWRADLAATQPRIP